MPGSGPPLCAEGGLPCLSRHAPGGQPVLGVPGRPWRQLDEREHEYPERSPAAPAVVDDRSMSVITPPRSAPTL
ncbi:hypothetical protein [Pseudonocardia alni]|uniref:Uncharacterized protein n=1 Tax=Pseudonocardia alni TaxID=33907 RepID=A0A852W3N4_PSEA5|nr:hypothetical protein [Pseudonocardia antarctica]NYG00995.1 hypothetical protein [Pseudonocardia antarctica]